MDARQQPVKLVADFTFALERRFGPSSYENHQVAFFNLHQTSYVMEYQAQFERLSNHVVGLNPDALLNCFLSGLRTDIYRELTVLRSTTL